MKCLPLDETMIEVFYGNNQLAFRFDNTIFTTRLIEGNFPNYRPVIHTEQAITVVMKRHQLLQAIDRASLFDRGGSQPVIIQVTDGVLEIGMEYRIRKVIRTIQCRTQWREWKFSVFTKVYFRHAKND